MDMFEKRLHHNFDNIFVPCLALKDIDCKPLFFQSVFCHPDVSPSIIAINKLACDVFDRTGNGCGYPGAYMPHLSVVYGDLTSAQKEATISTILSPSLIEKKFNFGSLQLWKTEGLHTEWSCVKKVPLPLPYFNNSLPRHTFQVRSRIKRSMSFDFRENHDMNFQSCTMTRSDIMQWAIARRALIAAHKAGMKQLRGERDYETSNGLDSHYSQLQKTQQQAHKFEKQLSRISERTKSHDRGVQKQLQMRTKFSVINNVIRAKIHECIAMGGEDMSHAQQILNHISNYNFENGIAGAGMSWGTIGHAVKSHWEDGGGDVKRRSSTGMLGRYSWEEVVEDIYDAGDDGYDDDDSDSEAENEVENFEKIL
ncbi:hypothetical protein ScalyP_jg10182 [Parmales sp. scaly parma]|nr:hypothetical protein ScalyP_jg10182 [Parmales sp. scaly parma]